MSYKPFDRALFDKYDEIGKQKVSDYIEWEWGCTVSEASKYGIDLLATRKGVPVGYIEVEVRNWNAEVCPFNTIHVPSRKAKYLSKHEPAIFFAVNSNLKNGYWCSAKAVLQSQLQEIKNREVAHGELFYNVPKHLFNFVKFIL